MKRRSFLQISAAALAAVGTSGRGAWAQSGESFDVAEKSITQLQAAMAAGQVTSEQLVSRYLARIKAYDQAGPRLNAVIAINPRAASDAQIASGEFEEAREPRSRFLGFPQVTGLRDDGSTAPPPLVNSISAVRRSLSFGGLPRTLSTNSGISSSARSR